MKKSAFIYLIIVVFIFVAHTSNAQQKYAFLYSAGETLFDSTEYNSEYWYDLVLVYDDLIKQGYSHDNIIVFYGDGKDFESKNSYYNTKSHGWKEPIVDFDNSYLSLFSVFAYFSDVITDRDDILFRWIVGHGGNEYTKDDYVAGIENENSSISEKELNDLINLVKHYRTRQIIWMTCHSGCIAKGAINYNNDKTIVLTASDWDNVSYSLVKNGVPHCELNYAIQSAIRGTDSIGNTINIDNNKDNKINYNELFKFLRDNPYLTSKVQMADEGMNSEYFRVK